MRQIKFRVMGSEGAWHYLTLGDFVCRATITAQLDPETWTQFTGLKDANGVEIYESDVVSDHVGAGLVRYSEKHAAFRVSYGDGLAKWFYDYNLKYERESILVIGNEFQNPELLK